jgi:phage major head subunit gpT-like protein
MNNEWVKIKKLGDAPEDDELVFVALRDGTVTTAYHKSGLYFDEYERNRLKNVTHWMSYPKHPLAFKF